MRLSVYTHSIAQTAQMCIRDRADPTLRYRDIAVLTRVKQNVLAPMARVLADEGIPVYADEAGGYTDAFEVRLALALLKLVDNHLDCLLYTSFAS